MIIKKFVVGSMFSMLLVSEMAVAAWGDVYYCQMTNSFGLTLEGEKKNYKLEKFQFKLDQTKNAMVFGSKGYFTNNVLKLGNEWNFPNLGIWFANDEYSSAYFSQGKLSHTANRLGDVSIKTADCEKF